MAKKTEIVTELSELQSSLAGADIQNIYSVPVGYFEGLASEILKRVKALDTSSVQAEMEVLSPLLSSLKKENLFSVPEGYFDTLGKKIEHTFSDGIDRDVQRELEEISPLLNSLKNKTTYTIPAGYFETLKPAVKPESGMEPAKVIPLTGRKWVRYAAAAIVIGFIATIPFLNRGGQEKIDPSTKSFAWVEKNLKKVSTDDITKFVELTTDNAEATDISKAGAKDEIIAGLLKDVSDKEIQDFLNDTQASDGETIDELILN